MPGAGPAPSLNPKRSNPRVGIQVLPAEGRKGPAPAWPLPGKASAAERQAWTALWASPQAVMWERLGWTRVVARYARMMLLAEAGTKEAWPEARQLEDRLGLTPKAMRVLLWVVSDDEVAAKRQAPPSTGRRRMRAVDAG